MDPNQPPTEQPSADQPPAWATQLTEQFNAINTKIDSFTEEVNTKFADLTPPAPIAEPVKEDEFIPQTWEDVTQKAKDETIAEIEKRENEKKQADEQATQEYEENVKRINESITTSLDSLAEAGQIPKIENPADKDDPGVKHRLELLQLADVTDSLNFGVLNEALNLAHKNGMIFDVAAKAFVAVEPPTTQNLPPLSGNSPQSSKGKMSLQELRGKSLAQLASELPQ